MACLVHHHQDQSTVLLFAQVSPDAEEEIDGESCQQSLADVMASERRPRFFGLRMITARVAGLVSGLGGYVARGMAAEDLELAELPPPYVPALFGVVLLAGVGVLTASLGDVMEEGTFFPVGSRAKVTLS